MDYFILYFQKVICWFLYAFKIIKNKFVPQINYVLKTFFIYIYSYNKSNINVYTFYIKINISFLIYYFNNLLYFFFFTYNFDFSALIF